MADVQPPEGLRKIVVEAIGNVRCPHVPLWVCASCGAEAALAALFEACEVREDFPMTYTTPYTKLPREVVHQVREGAVVGARMYTQEGFTPVKVEHRWTLRYSQPVMRMYDDGEPVSSTGEEPTDG